MPPVAPFVIVAERQDRPEPHRRRMNANSLIAGTMELGLELVLLSDGTGIEDGG
jgi:hypothetical protein